MVGEAVTKPWFITLPHSSKESKQKQNPTGGKAWDRSDGVFLLATICTRKGKAYITFSFLPVTVRGTLWPRKTTARPFCNYSRETVDFAIITNSPFCRGLNLLRSFCSLSLSISNYRNTFQFSPSPKDWSRLASEVHLSAQSLAEKLFVSPLPQSGLPASTLWMLKEIQKFVYSVNKHVRCLYWKQIAHNFISWNSQEQACPCHLGSADGTCFPALWGASANHW